MTVTKVTTVSAKDDSAWWAGLQGEEAAAEHRAQGIDADYEAMLADLATPEEGE